MNRAALRPPLCLAAALLLAAAVWWVRDLRPRRGSSSFTVALQAPPLPAVADKRARFMRSIDSRNQLARALDSSAFDPDLAMKLAKADGDLGNYAAAIGTLERVRQREPGRLSALYALSLYQGRLTHFESARRLAERMIAESPQQAEGYLALSWAHYRRGMRPAAAAALRRATERDLPREARYRIAAQYAKVGDPVAAIAQLKTVLDMNADFQPGWTLLGATHLGLSQPQEARRCLEKSTALNPQDARAHQLLAQTWLADAASVTAERAVREHVERALVIDPGDVEAHLTSAKLFQRQRRWQDAANSYVAALRLRPELEAARYALGHVYAQCGLRERARAQQGIYTLLHGRAVERTRLVSNADVSPPSVSGLLALARFHARHGDYAEAIEAAQKAEATAPRDPRPESTLASIMNEVGWREESLRAQRARAKERG